LPNENNAWKIPTASPPHLNANYTEYKKQKKIENANRRIVIDQSPNQKLLCTL